MRRLPPRQRAILRALARHASELGLETFLVGGAVRDLLLGRETTDLDVAVDGEVGGLADRLGGAVVRHGAFGTASVTLADGLRIDLARLRAETYPRPGALPRVVPAGLAPDLARRDFTVNAMALPLRARGFGALIDPHSGGVDLEARRLRLLHERSIIDDPTRAFRAVGFAVRLDFEIESGTRRLIRSAERGGAFDTISATRLRREISRLFDEPGAARVVTLMRALRLTEAVCGGTRIPRGAREALLRADELVDRSAGEACRWLVTLGVLLARMERKNAGGWIARLKPDRRSRVALTKALDAPRLLERLERPTCRRPSRVHRVCRDRTVEELLAAAAYGARPKPREMILEYLHRLRHVRADVDGRDLIRAGVPAGPAVARGLRAALEAKLDGLAPRREDQLRCGLRRA